MTEDIYIMMEVIKL